MILCIGDILGEHGLASVGDLVRSATFEDGAATAGWAARLVKHNRQMAADSPGHDALVTLLIDALRASKTLMAAALPKALRPPLVSLSAVGMGYGTHVDDALMGQPHMRADLSYTLFLNSAEEYDGGELVLEDMQGEHVYKLPAGVLVLYPSTYLHRVEPVRRGRRLVAVGWVQSVCRSAAHREILFDLYTLMNAEFDRHGKSSEFDLLAKSRANLLRLFAEV